jgi:hypothetical protein
MPPSRGLHGVSTAADSSNKHSKKAIAKIAAAINKFTLTFLPKTGGQASPVI